MAYISHKKLWESKFDGIVPKRDKLRDLNFNQLKLEVQDTYKKITTIFKPVNDEAVIDKAYLDEELFKKRLSYLTSKRIITKVIYNTINIL